MIRLKLTSNSSWKYNDKATKLSTASRALSVSGSKLSEFTHFETVKDVFWGVSVDSHLLIIKRLALDAKDFNKLWTIQTILIYILRWVSGVKSNFLTTHKCSKMSRWLQGAYFDCGLLHSSSSLLKSPVVLFNFRTRQRRFKLSLLGRISFFWRCGRSRWVSTVFT